MIVTLTPAEFLLAWMTGGMRCGAALRNGTKPAWGSSGDFDAERAGKDIIGALAEAAISKEFNLYWDPAVGETNRVDVGGKVEVRSVSAPTYHLIFHRKDKPHMPYVLVYPAGFDIHLLGWMYGRDGMQEKYWRDPRNGRPQFYVPQSDLRPMPLLHDELAQVAA